jgi:formylglycine-generating enzyme required for sulfatase activity
MVTKATNHSTHGLGKLYICSLVLLSFLFSGCIQTADRGNETQAPITESPVSIHTQVPTKNSTPSPTQIPVSPTPALGIGSKIISDKDGMTLVYVPAGEFTMGSDDVPSSDDQSPSYYDNRPQHPVVLDAYWIDQTEVTNRQYALCVTEGACSRPANLNSPMRSSYYGDPQFDNYPVIHMEWGMAKAYCEWAGRRLPTEAEWEKAARGTDMRIYPWGNTPPKDSLLNYNSTNHDTTEVGKYPEGQSPYGAYDMAGNVWEWVHDWHDPAYYLGSPLSNPMGPDSGNPPNETRVLRGGSWYYLDGSLRSDVRSFALEKYENTSIYGRTPYGLGTVGFRCAVSTAP